MMPTDAPTIPDMLYWYEGMLLMPEHFQSANRRQEALGGYLAQACAPYPWGVRTLETDLQDGILTVRKLEAVMPDGLVVRYSEQDSESPPLQIDLKRHKPPLEPQKKRAVHLVIPAWSDQMVAQEGAEAAVLGRYRSVRGAQLGRDDPDPGLNEPAIEAMHERPWLRPILKLYTTEGPLTRPPAKYVSIPLARVFVNAESAIVADRYEPPRLAIAGAGELLACARDVANELRGKARLLNERLQRDNALLPDQQESDKARTFEAQVRLLTRSFQRLQQNVENLQALVRTVPRLEALAKDAFTHPLTLYLALCDIVGDMALLGGELNLPEIPPYAHADALAAFDFLQRHILTMAESLNQRFRVFAFERVTPGRFELVFKARDLPEHFVLGAVRGKGAPASPVKDWMTKAIIITDEQRLDAKMRRVGGAVRQPIERDETLDLVAPSMTSLFRVERSVDAIDPNGTTLVVEKNSGEPPVAILLYVPRELAFAMAQPSGIASPATLPESNSSPDAATPSAPS